MPRTIVAALAAVCFCLSPRIASAQGKTFSGDHYSISFAAGWDTIQTQAVLGKYGGLNGLATMGSTLGNSLPDIDSLTAAYADTLGGDIRKDSSGSLTIGKYDVHWQKFTYDSLPALSDLISSTLGFPVSLQKGEFRVYYLASDGVVFTLACMAVLGSAKPPYADVEAALATLKLNPLSGIIPLGRDLARDLWVRDGKLGGGWLKANRVYAVECYDVRGAFLGLAAHAPEGAWRLPKSGSEMLVRLRTAQGAGAHFLVRP
jgi:hypothetical protein